FSKRAVDLLVSDPSTPLDDKGTGRPSPVRFLLPICGRLIDQPQARFEPFFGLAASRTTGRGPWSTTPGTSWKSRSLSRGNPSGFLQAAGKEHLPSDRRLVDSAKAGPARGC